MPPRLVLGVSLGGVAVLSAWLLQDRFAETPTVFDPPLRHVEAAPLCPWREPERDQRTFFPSATRHTSETRILSAQRVELQQHLGRIPEPEENAMLRHRVFAGTECVGFISTRRVKGEHGAIELVVAVNLHGEVAGVSIQRLREPEAIANALQNRDWLHQFHRRTHEHGWDAKDLDALPKEARISGGAVREGVRSLLILHAAAEGKLT
jgi:hypothetical protein